MIVSSGKTILDLSAREAREFLMLQDSYCSFDLPHYFDFNQVLGVSRKLVEQKKELVNLCERVDGRNRKPENYDGVNHVIIANKDGKLGWRMFSLIHPILYADLVCLLTEESNWNLVIQRIRKLEKDKQISSCGWPVETITNKQSQKKAQIAAWWKLVEQRSIELALDYKYLYTTDIASCYSSIYTHSIPWAMHGYKEEKERVRSRATPLNLGEKIDEKLRNMSCGQTNGIPQGSILMDFIAEIFLSYVDKILTLQIRKKKINDYHIIRFRDDYRVFTNKPTDAEFIIKELGAILMQFGLALNYSKTIASVDIVRSAIKLDKVDAILEGLDDATHELTRHSMCRKKINAQRILLRLCDFAESHQNAGELVILLNRFYSLLNSELKVRKKSKYRAVIGNDEVPVLISMLTHLTYNNPRVYPQFTAILSLLLSRLSDEKKKLYLDKVRRKFSDLPNTSFLDIWLQRIYAKVGCEDDFAASLCKLARGETVPIWNSEWLDTNIKKQIEACSLIDSAKMNQKTFIVEQVEVDAFVQLYSTKSVV